MLGAAAVVGIGKKREIMTNLPRCTMTTSSSQNNFCDGVAGDDCCVSVARTTWVVAGHGNVSGGGCPSRKSGFNCEQSQLTPNFSDE